MKFKLMFLSMLTLLLASCGGLEVEPEISYSSFSDVTDEGAIVVTDASSTNIVSTGALNGRVTCSVELKMEKALGVQCDYGYCSLKLLDENGAKVISLHPSGDDNVKNFAKFFSSESGTTKTFAFESTEKSRSNLEEMCKTIKKAKIVEVHIRKK